MELEGFNSVPIPADPCSVVQGSKLSGLLFLIYINDMTSACDCNLFLFADDSALLVSDRSQLEVEKALSSELGKISTWLADNKLSLHLGKTESILFGSNYNLSKADGLKVKVGDSIITQKDEITYLGSILEANLSGDKMASKVVKKVNQRIKFLYRISPLVNNHTLRTLTGALVQSFFDYACASWYHSTSKAMKTRLQTSQNKLVRLLLGLAPRTHLTPAHFDRVGWLRVDDRVQYLAMAQVHKIRYSSKIPRYLSNYFLNVNEVHTHNTRGSATNHVQPRSCTNKGLNSFRSYATKMWNSLPTGIKSCTSLDSFKASLKEHLRLTAIRNWPP